MKLLHISDTHVGFAAYTKLTPEGLNQREQDLFDAFSRTIDLALAERVDVVLHTGDLFDSVRPTNRAITHVLAELKRLHAGGIPFVVISGNHEAPRLRETGAVLKVLDFMPGVTAVYKGVTEVVRVGPLAIHATPHAANNDALRANLAAVKPAEGARWNVAALHAGVMGVGDFRTGEFNEQVVAQNELPEGMDYTALGHYHRRTQIADKVWYAGSPERLTFKELGEEKGVLLVDLARGRVEKRDLPTRPMLDLGTIECGGLQDALIPGAIHDAIVGAKLDGSIARLRIAALPPAIYATLDFARLRKLTTSALHFELQTEVARAEASGASGAAIGRLAEELDAFLAARPLPEGERDALAAEGRAVLQEAEAS